MDRERRQTSLVCSAAPPWHSQGDVLILLSFQSISLPPHRPFSHFLLLPLLSVLHSLYVYLLSSSFLSMRCYSRSAPSTLSCQQVSHSKTHLQPHCNPYPLISLWVIRQESARSSMSPHLYLISLSPPSLLSPTSFHLGDKAPAATHAAGGNELG